MSALTIVHVSNFITGLRAGPHHSVEIKLSNGLTRLGHLVLNFAERDLARAKSWTGSRKFGKKGLNAALIDFCRVHRPDIVLFGHADMIEPATIAAIREGEGRPRVAQWNVDGLFEPDNVAKIRSKLDVVDATFVSTAGAPLEALREGRHVMSFMPNPADPSIERGRVDLNPAPAFDLFYACGDPASPLRHICGRDWNMNDFIDQLAARAPDVKMKLGGVHGAPLSIGAAYQDILEQSAIGLNLSRRPDHYLYSSDRIAQLAGNGCLVAIERKTGYGDYFGEDEMLFFGSLGDLAEKLTRLSRDPKTRMAMARAGRARYLEKFNERAVAAHLLAVLMGERAPQDMPW